MADPTQIHQIIMNLCTNAAQAMEDDGGKLIIDLYDAEIRTKTQDFPVICQSVIISN
ncbi:MAG: hypothetical protein R2861_10870 [Desulfobacterales bacterium]